MKNTIEINGTHYYEGTDKKLIEVLERVRNNRERIKVYFGDKETGKNWNEEYDTVGYVGRSTGTKKIPLLVYNSRSYGGGALMTDCILKVRTTKGRVLYTHPKFKNPLIEIVPINNGDYKFRTIVDGDTYGQHKSLKSAENLKKKLQ